MQNLTVELDSIAIKIYEIIKMNLKLSKTKDKTVLSKFHDYALRVDSILTKDYQEGLTIKYYKPKTLEEEVKRLEDLINYIEKRQEERKDFVYEYLSTSKQKEIDLDDINEINDIDKYQKKINNIKEYLYVAKNINKLSSDSEKYQNEIKSLDKEKENNELIDIKLENEILNKYEELIKKIDYYKTINIKNINEELLNAESELNLKQKTMDTFDMSYEILMNSPISDKEKEEYKNYIKEARSDYYITKEKEVILKVYKMLLKKETDYIKIYTKRELLEETLVNLLMLRKKYEIEDTNPILDIYSLASEHFTVLKLQKEVMDSIYKKIDKIKANEKKINDMKEKTQSEDILVILKEFEIIDIYDTDKIFEQALNEIVGTKDVYKIDLDKIKEDTYKVLIVLAKSLNIEVIEKKKEIKEETIKNIGSVQPTNVLKALEETNLKLPDLILPSMGLSNTNDDIKIRGDEYIKEGIEFNKNTNIFND